MRVGGPGHHVIDICSRLRQPTVDRQRPSRQQLGGQHSESVNVARWGGASADQFGSRVSVGGEVHQVVEDRRQTQVRQIRVAGVIEEDVLGSHSPVCHPHRVRPCQRRTDPLQGGQRLLL